MLSLGSLHENRPGSHALHHVFKPWPNIVPVGLTSRTSSAHQQYGQETDSGFFICSYYVVI